MACMRIKRIFHSFYTEKWMVKNNAIKLILALCIVFVIVSCTVLSCYYSTNEASDDEALEIPAPLKPEGVQFEKWIVITTLSPPTDDVKFLASLSGWRVVVVGDVATPHNWSHPNCMFLGLEQQKKLGYFTADLIPEKSYSRKNIGYLYAIQHGAKVIYETDDDNRPLYGLERFDYSSEFSALEFSGRDLFNPYHHFGQSTLWPRGFPLSAIGQVSERMTYRMPRYKQTPLIQQGIVNGDPDMDAIFRLTRKRVDHALNVHFDPAAPTAVLPAGVYSPFNSQNTLFHYDAFWALLIPTATTMRVCDIWRSYWAQRLLWEIGGSLAFYPPNAYQKRNSHSYLLDAMDELQLYTDTEKLIDFLRQWVCHPHLSFYGCVKALTFDLVVAGLWNTRDAKVTKTWLADLRRTGYKEPARKPLLWTSNDGQSDDTIKGFQSPNDCFERDQSLVFFSQNNNSFIIFYPAEQVAPPMKSKDLSPMPRVIEHMMMAKDICPDSQLQVNLSSLPLKNDGANFFNDILVIVIFHYPDFYDNIRFLESAYRMIFPNLIYCGPNRVKFQAAMENISFTNRISFIEADINCGFLAYSCLLEAMRAGYNVTGYLSVSDDVLINPWTFMGMNKSRIWLTKGQQAPLNKNLDEKWSHWSMSHGKKAFHFALYDIFTSQRPTDVIDWDSVVKTLETTAGGSDKIMRGLVDVYYVPKRLQKQVVWYLSMFLKRAVFLEIALPVVMYGLEANSDIETITGQSQDENSRGKMWDHFNSKSHFLHPIKLGIKEWIQPFCSQFMTTMMKKMYGL
ncbi:conserved uncharacterized protein [Plakobranchus ocellatus]|uniref:Conserved uncharacterized protein n=1 Tax=Plakobranchus ocellatus TaxID=259542 RepID=A0AAV3YMU5_9GAST|nr:conserved uncharacterized protein [Plakobranchus ocellatus]